MWALNCASISSLKIILPPFFILILNYLSLLYNIPKYFSSKIFLLCITFSHLVILFSFPLLVFLGNFPFCPFSLQKEKKSAKEENNLHFLYLPWSFLFHKWLLLLFSLLRGCNSDIKFSFSPFFFAKRKKSAKEENNLPRKENLQKTHPPQPHLW